LNQRVSYQLLLQELNLVVSLGLNFLKSPSRTVRRRMDETKLTPEDKKEIEESGRELILGTIQKIMEMLEELKER